MTPFVDPGSSEGSDENLVIPGDAVYIRNCVARKTASYRTSVQLYALTNYCKN